MDSAIANIPLITPLRIPPVSSRYDRAVISPEPEDVEQPSLKALGYHFDNHGVMRDKNEKRYEFIDQKSYEVIGSAVTQEIYRIMENPPYNMERQYLDSTNRTRSAFIFLSRDWYQKENLVILIHGSGFVRAGQWSRRLIMNESLNMGSQLPYLRMCRSRDWGVIVMNTNMNVTDNNPPEPLPGSRTPLEHGITVWEKYIARSKASSIAVVAHSAGGTVIAGIIENYWSKEWMKRLKCVCLTDAVFTLPSVSVMKWLPAIKDWRASQHAEIGLRIDNTAIDYKTTHLYRTDFGDFGDNLISGSVECLATIRTKVSCSNQIQIRRDELITVANGDSCRINNSLDKEKRPFPPVIVVDRALLMIGKTDYNLLLNNCEHFAKYCRYGLKESNQATVAKIILVISATYCMTGSLAVSAVAGSLTYTFARLGRDIKQFVPFYPDVLL
uniref:LRAT domain-containing protein n=1 Tax=Loa loa TaxID=7209 RepID=A0A1I7V859_LOALO